MNERRHRYLEKGQLESIGGGGVVVRGEHLPWVGVRAGGGRTRKIMDKACVTLWPCHLH